MSVGFDIRDGDDDDNYDDDDNDDDNDDEDDDDDIGGKGVNIFSNGSDIQVVKRCRNIGLNVQKPFAKITLAFKYSFSKN